MALEVLENVMKKSSVRPIPAYQVPEAVSCPVKMLYLKDWWSSSSGRAPA
jgi:hypothetical protein